MHSEILFLALSFLGYFVTVRVLLPLAVHLVWLLVGLVTVLWRSVRWAFTGSWHLPDKPRLVRDITPGWVMVDRSGQPVGSEVEVDKLRIPEFTHLPVSAATGTAVRLRPRARFVRLLEMLLGEAPVTVGQLWRGRWTPDLPSSSLSHGANLILSLREEGVRILGGGSVQTDKPKDGVYVVCELADGSVEVLFPELVGRLAAYAIFRDRDATLLSALRLRALELCKKADLDGPTTHSAVLSALRFVWRPSPHESRTLECVGAAQPYFPSLRFGSA